MKLSSDAFEPNKYIPLKYSGYAGDINPNLIISEVPNTAKSLVLIVEDPDSPGKTWQHWLVWNIPPETSVIPEGALPIGAVEGLNDFGSTKYGGPMPHMGTHHYHFKLIALNKTLELSYNSSRQELDDAIATSIIDSTELVGLYDAKD